MHSITVIEFIHPLILERGATLRFDLATKGKGTKRAEAKIAILDMTHALEAAMKAAKRAGYRLDLLLKNPTGSSVGRSEQV